MVVYTSTTPRLNKLICGEQSVWTLLFVVNTGVISFTSFPPDLVTNHKVQRGATLQTLQPCMSLQEKAATENVSELELFCILVVVYSWNLIISLHCTAGVLTTLTWLRHNCHHHLR